MTGSDPLAAREKHNVFCYNNNIKQYYNQATRSDFMNDVSDVLSILNAGYEAQANKPVSKKSGWVPVKVGGIEFDCIRDALRGFSAELMANSDILVYTPEEQALSESPMTSFLFTDGVYMFLNYGIVAARKMFAQAGLRLEKI
jgi:hypothetical protein